LAGKKRAPQNDSVAGITRSGRRIIKEKTTKPCTDAIQGMDLGKKKKKKKRPNREAGGREKKLWGYKDKRKGVLKGKRGKIKGQNYRKRRLPCPFTSRLGAENWNGVAQKVKQGEEGILNDLHQKREAKNGLTSQVGESLGGHQTKGLVRSGDSTPG